MGALKDIYQRIMEELGGFQVVSDTSEAPFAEKLRRETVRHLVCKVLYDLECTLLLSPEQKDAMFLSQEEDEEAPFDALELIVKNNVSVKKHIGKIKECISELDEISTVEDSKESKESHRDELSCKVLNMLRTQTAQVLLLTGEDENGQASWFIKQPKEFIRAVMVDKDGKRDAFDDVRFDKGLDTVDLDCREYLRKSHSPSKKNAIRSEDEAFNKDALKLLKDIRAWEADMKGVEGKSREKLKKKIESAENVLAKATDARNSAIRDAFRTGAITEYYYLQRTEQLEKRDYSRVPEMFEVDALKNREQYLKDHDLQDLSKEEGDAICALALQRAKKEREIYLIKVFLSKRGLDHSKRYFISEMPFNKELFYRSLASGGKELEDPEEDEERRISVDLDEIGEDYIGMTMRQVPSPGEKVRSKNK